MSRRVTLAAALAAFASVVGFGAAPAVAAPSNTVDTPITFSISAGGLTITAPTTTVNLGSGVSGGSVSGTIGPVQVNDARGLLVAAWTATVSSTAFHTGGGTPSETIGSDKATYTPGVFTIVTGLPVPLPGLPGTLASPRTAYTATAVGVNAVSWDPTLSIALPAAAVAGTYSGTVTHSVA